MPVTESGFIRVKALLRFKSLLAPLGEELMGTMAASLDLNRLLRLAPPRYCFIPPWLFQAARCGLVVFFDTRCRLRYPVLGDRKLDSREALKLDLGVLLVGDEESAVVVVDVVNARDRGSAVVSRPLLHQRLRIVLRHSYTRPHVAVDEGIALDASWLLLLDRVSPVNFD